MEKDFVEAVCPPLRIQQAAVEIGDWFSDNNIKHWELAHCASRDSLEQLRQRVAELEKEAKQLRDLQYQLMRSGALVAIEKCKNATGQRRVIDMYVSANQIAEDLLNAMDSGA